jgi:hypothetical protein
MAASLLSGNHPAALTSSNQYWVSLASLSQIFISNRFCFNSIYVPLDRTGLCENEILIYHRNTYP